ncbi:hypothetical protein QAD02_017798 [Eretmocerus hayati]|uniref:Uncharacterized protein n=1 Tax=Eretmocerus hayati TaxID=131215 RepID=A0ACC2PG56_9HYME|nr:hypothetical protein QAD02_017798 [Eretmocerus hayati]
MSPQGSPSAGTTLIRISPPGPYRRVARTSIGRKSTEPRSGRVATDSKSPPIVAISPQGSPSARIRPRRGQASNILQEKHGTALETKVPVRAAEAFDEPVEEGFERKIDPGYNLKPNTYIGNVQSKILVDNYRKLLGY